MANNAHLPSLDGLRAISIIIVLSGHLTLPVRFVGVSALGLDIFFFVSGFLITRLFFAEFALTGYINLGSFYIRRFIRLYPVLIVYITLVTSVQYYRQAAISATDVASVFLYFLNYLIAYNDIHNTTTTIPIGVLWSLSVEEHFYLFAPFAFVLCNGRAREIAFGLIAIAAFCLSLRFLYIAMWPGLENTLFIYRHSETRFDSIGFGALLASMCQTQLGHRMLHTITKRSVVLSCFVLLLATYALRDNFFQSTARFTIQSLCLIPLIASVVLAAPFPYVNRVLNAAITRWVGRLSYSLYVWHGGVYFLFADTLSAHSFGIGPTSSLALTVTLACLSYYLVERPCLRLRHRFQPTARISPSSVGLKSPTISDRAHSESQISNS